MLGFMQNVVTVGTEERVSHMSDGPTVTKGVGAGQIPVMGP